MFVLGVEGSEKNVAHPPSLRIISGTALTFTTVRELYLTAAKVRLCTEGTESARLRHINTTRLNGLNRTGLL